MFISIHRPTWALGLTFLGASACLHPQPTSSPTTATDPTVRGSAIDPPDLSLDTRLERDRLACAVLAANPELAEWHDSWRAASARARQPTSVGTTSVSYSFAPGSIGADAVRYGQSIRVEQSFRLGQTKLERHIAGAQADAARHDVAAKRQQLVLAATTLFDEYYALTRALETNAEHEHLVDAMLDTATARYSTGHAPQQDPLQAEVELAHIEHEQVILKSQREVVVAQINGLLHRPPDTPIPPPPDAITVDTTEPAASDFRRPQTEAAMAEEQAAEHAKALARRRFSPSVSAMATYNSMWDRVEHQFMVGAGLSIPLQVRSLRAGVDEAEAMRSAARHRREAVEDVVAVERAVARHDLAEARHIVELHRNRLLPTARARVEAAHVGYETGANDFSTVIEAERELRTLDIAYHRALANLANRRAELDYAHGRALDCDPERIDR